MKEVVRSVETHEIYGIEVLYQNGNINVNELEPIIVERNGMKEERALKELRKVYGKNRHLEVKDIVTTKVKYACPLDKFMEYARVVNSDIKEDVGGTL